MQHPDRLEKLILASPVGVPAPTEHDTAIDQHRSQV
jgi:pimeloyl-ACP methyl ester carboxylesterase